MRIKFDTEFNQWELWFDIICFLSCRLGRTTKIKRIVDCNTGKKHSSEIIFCRSRKYTNISTKDIRKKNSRITSLLIGLNQLAVFFLHDKWMHLLFISTDKSIRLILINVYIEPYIIQKINDSFIKKRRNFK